MQSAAHPRQEPLDDEHLSWEAIVSTWMDDAGDIRPEDLDTPYGRQVWDTYHLIGDVLRSPELAIRPSEVFYARVSKAIDAEPTVLAPQRIRHSALRLGLSGVAVAAAVASVVWVALPYFNAGPSVPSQFLASAGPSDAAPASDPGLLDYLDAHRQIAGVSPVRQASFELEAGR